MANFRRGDLVFVSFPMQARDDFMQCAGLVLLSWPLQANKTDYLICLIDPKESLGPYKIDLHPSDLIAGEINQSLFIRPTYITTVAEHRIRRIGTISKEALNYVLDVLIGALDESEEDEGEDAEL